MVVIYSIGYMAGDPGYWRFFAYLGLFVFSMMMLVSVSNFLLLYVFWEAVGLLQLPADWLLVSASRRRPPLQRRLSWSTARGRLRLCFGDLPTMDRLRNPGHAR